MPHADGKKSNAKQTAGEASKILKLPLSKKCIKSKRIVEQKHSPDGKKRGTADAVTLGGPLVMQIVGQERKELTHERTDKDDN